MEISYKDLRSKDVVNLNNGAKFGRINDIIIDSNGKNVLGIVAPSSRKIFQREDVFIPWANIDKIGDDVILVHISLCKDGSKAICQHDNADFI